MRRIIFFLALLILNTCTFNLKKEDSSLPILPANYERILASNRQEALEMFADQVGRYVSNTTIIQDFESSVGDASTFKNISVSSSDIILTNVNEYKFGDKFVLEYPIFLKVKIIAAKLFSRKNNQRFEEAFHSIFVIKNAENCGDRIGSILKNLKKVNYFNFGNYTIIEDEKNIFKTIVIPFFKIFEFDQFYIDELNEYMEIFSLSEETKYQIENFSKYLYYDSKKDALYSYFYLAKCAIALKREKDPYFEKRLILLRDKIFDIPFESKVSFLRQEDIKYFIKRELLKSEFFQQIVDINLSPSITDMNFDVGKNYKFSVRSNFSSSSRIDILLITDPPNILNFEKNVKIINNRKFYIFDIKETNHVGYFKIYLTVNPRGLFSERFSDILFPLLPMYQFQMKATFLPLNYEKKKQKFYFKIKKMEDNKILIYLSSALFSNWRYYMFNIVLRGKNKGMLQYLPVYNERTGEEFSYWNWKKGFITKNFSYNNTYYLLFLGIDRELELTNILKKEMFLHILDGKEYGIQILRLNLNEL